MGGGDGERVRGSRGNPKKGGREGREYKFSNERITEIEFSLPKYPFSFFPIVHPLLLHTQPFPQVQSPMPPSPFFFPS